MKNPIVLALFFLFVISGCVAPDNLLISVNDKFCDAEKKLKYVESCLAGKGIVSESYFEQNDEGAKARWYLLPDNTLLGLNLIERKSKKENIKLIKQILLGEIGSGFVNKIRWDMQVKTLFQQLDLKKHKDKCKEPATIVLEVGQQYFPALKKVMDLGCTKSTNTYEYDKSKIVKYDWLMLPDGTAVQVCGYYDDKTEEKIHYIVEIDVCNSQALFNFCAESWFSVQSVHTSDLGKKIWGIDVQSSYFNVYKGMRLLNALRTLKIAECNELDEKFKINMQDVKFLSNRVKREDFTTEGFRSFQIDEDTALLIKTEQPVEHADEKICEMFIYTKAPDLESLKTCNYLIEFEFVDLVKPMLENWYELVN